MIGTVPWGADNCPQCGFRFDSQFWEEEYINTGGPDTPEDAVDIVLPMGVHLAMIYGDDECMQCEHYGASSCEPMVSFLDAYYNLAVDADFPEPRDSICGDFTLSPFEAFSEEVN